MPRFTGFVPGKGKTAIPPLSSDAIRPGMTSLAWISGGPAAGGGAAARRVMRRACGRDAGGGRDGSGLDRVAARSGTPPACAGGPGGRGASRITTMAPAAIRQTSAAPRRTSCTARRTAGASTSRTLPAPARGLGREESLGIARPGIICRGVRRLQTRATERIRAFAYPLGWRIAGASLFALSRASLPAILALVVLATDPPVTPPVLVRVVVVLALLPGLAARLVARAFAAELSVDDDALVIRRRDLRLEVPYRAVARLAPWGVALLAACVAPASAAGARRAVEIACQVVYYGGVPVLLLLRFLP